MLVFDSLWASIKTKISSFHQSISYKHVTDLQQEYMIVPFVDNGGINDHHCLNFLSIIRIVRSLSGNLATILPDNINIALFSKIQLQPALCVEMEQLISLLQYCFSSCQWLDAFARHNGRVKPKIIKLVFVASPLSTQH